MRKVTFTGRHSCKIDAKSRVSLPPELREELSEYDKRAVYMFVSPTTKNAIEACGREYMDGISDEIEKREALFSEKEDAILGAITGNAHKVKLDSTGRFTLPDKLREKLGDTVFFVGRGKRFQLWASEEAFDAHLQALSEGGTDE